MSAKSTTASKKKKPPEFGLFPACLEIGGAKPGAPLFRVSLLVNMPAETVTGSGQITQAVSPPLDIRIELKGNLIIATVMGPVVHYIVDAIGSPPVIGWSPSPPANVHLKMVLEGDWKKGVADYTYDGGRVKKAPVRQVPCQALP